MDYETVHILLFPVAPSSHDLRRTKFASLHTRERIAGKVEQGHPVEVDIAGWDAPREILVQEIGGLHPGFGLPQRDVAAC
ncbi:hypothetical protein ABIB99_003078 [Bradyrhizobium sp. LA6.1]|uniref:hypothetical protein n=1 Tax=Bradyrhizobium sp. LA6.1 TaxID=3156378 RepID=UPI003395C415